MTSSDSGSSRNGTCPRSGTVAVLLPGAFYTLRETKLPPVQGLRDAGVPIALATDCNPGTSPLTSLLLAMNMGATLFRMTPAECLAGVTVHAARALGLPVMMIDRPALPPRTELHETAAVLDWIAHAGVNLGV